MNPIELEWQHIKKHELSGQEVEIFDYWIVNLNVRQLERYSQPYQNAQGKFNYLSKQICLPHQSVVIPGFEDALLDLRILWHRTCFHRQSAPTLM